jgi:hypothetical protein
MRQTVSQSENHETAANPTPEESRQGEIGRDRRVRGPMRYVLIISTGLAGAALIIAYFAS